MPPEQFTPFFLTCFTLPMSVVWLSSLDTVKTSEIEAALAQSSPKATITQLADSEAEFVGLETLCGQVLAERGLANTAVQWSRHSGDVEITREGTGNFSLVIDGSLGCRLDVDIDADQVTISQQVAKNEGGRTAIDVPRSRRPIHPPGTPRP